MGAGLARECSVRGPGVLRGRKVLYWGGWCPRLLASDLAAWPPSVATYLNNNYPILEQQTGVSVATNFIQGSLFNLLKQRVTNAIGAVPNLDTAQDPPLAVEGQSPASGLFSFDKYTSTNLTIEAARDAASVPDAQRRFFAVPNAHVTRIHTTAGAASSIDVIVNGALQSLPVHSTCAVILALGTIESTRLALVSFPTSPGNPAGELMGRNLMAHWRSNIFVRINRGGFDPGNTLPQAVQTGALLVRGSAPQGKFHLQVTASADPQGNSDDLLFQMIPDIDLLDAILANQTANSISIAFRGVSQLFGDQGTSVPNATGRWINLSPFESDEFGVPRAYVQMTTDAAEDGLAQRDGRCHTRARQRPGRQQPGQHPGDRPESRRSRHHLPRGGHAVDGHQPGDIGDPYQRPVPPRGQAFCADQALFVTVGSVNPTLTGLVLARKVAEQPGGAGHRCTSAPIMHPLTHAAAPAMSRRSAGPAMRAGDP